MEIDVVVVNYFSETETIRCLRSILQTSLSRHPLNFFIGDNGSSLGFDALNGHKHLHVFSHPTNLGFARAVNQILSNSRAPIFLLVNPDTLFLDGPWSDFISFLEQHPDVGIVGPRIQNPDGTLQGSARVFPSPSTIFFGRKSPLTRWFPNNRYSRRNIVQVPPDCTGPVDVDWVSGACMAVRRSAFDAVNGFDEDFFLFWEDADLCARMKRQGWRICYDPRISVVHHVGMSRRHDVWRSHVAFHQSAYRFFLKHYPRTTLFHKMAVLTALGCHFGLSLLWDESQRARKTSLAQRR